MRGRSGVFVSELIVKLTSSVYKLYYHTRVVTYDVTAEE